MVSWNDKYVEATHTAVTDRGAVAPPFALGEGPVLNFNASCLSPLVYVQRKWREPTQRTVNFALRTQGHTFVRCALRANQTFLLVAPPRLRVPAPAADDDAVPPGGRIRDVVLLLFDALSSEKFRVSFPLTYALISHMDSLSHDDASSTHESFRFTRHTVRGSNSPPNKLALFAGLDQQVTRSDGAGARWLWRRAEAAGFATQHGEGECGGKDSEFLSAKRIKNRGFYSHTRGWSRGTVSHWTLLTESRMPALVNFPASSLCAAEKMGTETCNIIPERARYRNGFNYQLLCVGHEPVYRHLLQYAQSFLHTNTASRRLSTSILVETHEQLVTYPTLDAELAAAIRGWTRGGEGGLRDAAIVLMSDHGIHFGSEYRTKHGFIHHKLPLATLLLPRAYLDAHPAERAALRGNTFLLTTHLDMYRTLSEFIAGGTGSLDAEFAVTGEAAHLRLNNMSHSLLRALPNRTCAEAGVTRSLCPCGMYCVPHTQLTPVPPRPWAAFTEYAASVFRAAGMSHVCNNFTALPFRLATTCRAPDVMLYRIRLKKPLMEVEVFVQRSSSDTVVQLSSMFADRAQQCEATEAFRHAAEQGNVDDLAFRKVQEYCIC